MPADRGTILKVAGIPEKAEIAGTGVFICPQDNLTDRPDPPAAGEHGPFGWQGGISIRGCSSADIKGRYSGHRAGLWPLLWQVARRCWSGRG
jgi:hypothetical protein